MGVMGNLSIFSLSHGERVPEGWVRGSKPLINSTPSPSGTPHPSAYAPTFSPWEKGSVERAA